MKIDYTDADYNVLFDKTRQLGQVYAVMKNGRAITIWGLRATIYEQFNDHHSETAISARIRDLRKAKYGSHTVETKRRSKGVYEYRLVK